MRKKILNFATIAVILFYIIYNTGFFIFGCLYEFKSKTEHEYKVKVYLPLQYMTQVFFTALALLFIVISILLIRKLQRDFELFYKELRVVLLVATFLLTVPLTFRALFDGIKLVNPDLMEQFNDSYLKNSIYNLVFYLLTTYLPVIGQITSLVFGFVRHR